MKLKLIRKIYTDTSTIGDLFIDNEYFAKTLEDKVRDVGEPKIWGKTAIPAGTYKVVISFSNRFQQRMPEVLNVPGFLGIRLHSGSYPENTDGCILVGYDNPSKNFINKSKLACKELYKRIEKVSKTEKITIEIIDSKH